MDVKPDVKKISRKVSEFFAELLRELLKGKGKKDDVYYELLRGHVNRASDDIKQYVKKRCKGDDLFEFFKVRKNYFVVDPRTKSVRLNTTFHPTTENRARTVSVELIGAGTNCAIGENGSQWTSNNRLRSISQSEAVFCHNTGGWTSTEFGNTRSASTSSMSVSESDVEQLTVYYFEESITDGGGKLFLKDIHFSLLPEYIKDYLKKYSSQKLQMFFLDHCDVFCFDPSGSVTLVGDESTCSESVNEPRLESPTSASSADPTSKHPKLRKRKRKLTDASNEDDDVGSSAASEAVEEGEVRTVQFFVDILERRKSAALKKLAGHMSQAPEEVSAYVKAHLKGPLFRKLFTKHQKIFYVVGNNVSLVNSTFVKYSTQLEAMRAVVGISYPQLPDTVTGDRVPWKLKKRNVWSDESDVSDGGDDDDEYYDLDAAVSVPAESFRRLEPLCPRNSLGKLPVSAVSGKSTEPLQSREARNSALDSSRKPNPLDGQNSASSEKSSAESLVRNAPVNGSKHLRNVQSSSSSGQKREGSAIETNSASASYANGEEAVGAKKPRSVGTDAASNRSSSDDMRKTSIRNRSGGQNAATLPERFMAKDHDLFQTVELEIAEVLWTVELYSLEMMEMGKMQEEIQNYAVEHIVGILEKETNINVEDLEKRICSLTKKQVVAHFDRMISRGVFLKFLSACDEFDVEGPIISRKRNPSDWMKLREKPKLKVIETERKFFVKNLYYCDGFNNLYVGAWMKVDEFLELLVSKAKNFTVTPNEIIRGLSVVSTPKSDLPNFTELLCRILKRLKSDVCVVTFLEFCLRALFENFYVGWLLKGGDAERPDDFFRYVSKRNCSSDSLRSRTVFIAEKYKHLRSMSRSESRDRNFVCNAKASAGEMTCKKDIKSVLLRALMDDYDALIPYSELPAVLARANKSELMRNFRPSVLFKTLEAYDEFTCREAGLRLNFSHLSQTSMAGVHSKATVDGFFCKRMKGKSFIIDTEVKCDVVNKLVSSYPKYVDVSSRLISVYHCSRLSPSNAEPEDESVNRGDADIDVSSSSSASTGSGDVSGDLFSLTSPSGTTGRDEVTTGHVSVTSIIDVNGKDGDNCRVTEDCGDGKLSFVASDQSCAAPKHSENNQPFLENNQMSSVIIDRENESKAMEDFLFCFPNSYARFVCVDHSVMPPASSGQSGGEQPEDEDDVLEEVVEPKNDVVEPPQGAIFDSQSRHDAPERVPSFQHSENETFSNDMNVTCHVNEDVTGKGDLPACLVPEPAESNDYPDPIVHPSFDYVSSNELGPNCSETDFECSRCSPTEVMDEESPAASTDADTKILEAPDLPQTDPAEVIGQRSSGRNIGSDLVSSDRELCSEDAEKFAATTEDAAAPAVDMSMKGGGKPSAPEQNLDTENKLNNAYFKKCIPVELDDCRDMSASHRSSTVDADPSSERFDSVCESNCSLIKHDGRDGAESVFHPKWDDDELNPSEPSVALLGFTETEHANVSGLEKISSPVIENVDELQGSQMDSSVGTESVCENQDDGVNIKSERWSNSAAALSQHAVTENGSGEMETQPEIVDAVSSVERLVEEERDPLVRPSSTTAGGNVQVPENSTEKTNVEYLTSNRAKSSDVGEVQSVRPKLKIRSRALKMHPKTENAEQSCDQTAASRGSNNVFLPPREHGGWFGDRKVARRFGAWSSKEVARVEGERPSPNSNADCDVSEGQCVAARKLRHRTERSDDCDDVVAEIRRRRLERYERRKKANQESAAKPASAAKVPVMLHVKVSSYLGKVILVARNMCLVEVTAEDGGKRVVYCQGDLFKCSEHGGSCKRTSDSLSLGDVVNCWFLTGREGGDNLWIATSFSLAQCPGNSDGLLVVSSGCNRRRRSADSPDEDSALGSSSRGRSTDSADGAPSPGSRRNLPPCSTYAGARDDAPCRRCSLVERQSFGQQVDAGHFTVETASQTISTGPVFQQGVFLEE